MEDAMPTACASQLGPGHCGAGALWGRGIVGQPSANTCLWIPSQACLTPLSLTFLLAAPDDHVLGSLPGVQLGKLWQSQVDDFPSHFTDLSQQASVTIARLRAAELEVPPRPPSLPPSDPACPHAHRLPRGSASMCTVTHPCPPQLMPVQAKVKSTTFNALFMVQT